MPDEPAALLAKRFIARRDVKAVQQHDGAYHPDRTPFTMSDLRSHVAGTSTFGHYLVNQQDECKLFVFDIDLKKTGVILNDDDSLIQINPREAWSGRHAEFRPVLTTELRCLAEGLARTAKRILEVDVAVAYSGNKGLHVYGWTGPIPAADARAAAVAVLDYYGCFELCRGINFYKHVSNDPRKGYPNVEIEVYPKQDTLDGKDLGNLVRLPLGINRKSKQQGFFLDIESPPNTLVAADPVAILTNGTSW